MDVHALGVALVDHRSDVGVFDEAVLDDAVLGADAAGSAAGAFDELLTGVEQPEIPQAHASAAVAAVEHDRMVEELPDRQVGHQRPVDVIELETGARASVGVLLAAAADDDVFASARLATESDVAQGLR